MSNLRRTAVLLLGLGLLSLLLFLKGRSEPSAAKGSAARGPVAQETGPEAAPTAAVRPAKPPIPWNTRPKQSTEILDKITPGIMAVPAGGNGSFVVRDRHASAFFANGMVAIALAGRRGQKRAPNQGFGLHWSPEGASDVDPKPRGELSARVNRMVGDSKTWALDQQSYSAIDYDGILPGIDMTVESRPHGLKYTLYAAAGADVSNLKFRYQGAAGVQVMGEGAGIQILTDLGPIVENELHCWQDTPSGRKDVDAKYVATGVDSYQIVLGDLDPNLPTTIDPTIGWSTFMGASMAPNNDWEEGHCVAVDTAVPPNIYVAGATGSVDFPSVGAYDTTLGGYQDVFVTKIRPSNPAGTQVLWSTFLGGSLDEVPYGIAVDASQNVYVTGYSGSSDFPMAGNPIRTINVNSEAFVVKFNPSLAGASQLVWSTFIGGNDSEAGRAIAVDNASPPNVYVAGWTWSTNLPIVSGFRNSAQNAEGFIFKLDGAKMTGVGSPILWSTYMGGSDSDYIYGMTLDSSFNVYVTGTTYSPSNTGINFGSVFKPAYGGGGDMFVTKVSSGGTLLYSSYIGGTNYETGNAIAVDTAAPTPNIYVCGYTYSTDITPAPGIAAYQKNNASTNADTFVIKIAPGALPAAQVVWCSYLGGTYNDYGFGINVDPTGNAIVSGYTSSGPFASGPGGFDQTFNASGNWDGFVARFNTGGTALSWWTYVGGNNYDNLLGQAMDSSGNVYVTGVTYSSDFPTTASAFKPTLSGNGDAFVTKISNAGGGLLWSSYLGGQNGAANDEARRVEFDLAGNMYVAGITNGTDFPMAGTPFSGSLTGDYDVFISKITPSNPTATMLIWTAYLGGSWYDEVSSLVVDPGGSFVAVGGYSESPDFPHSFAYPNVVGTDGFVTKISSSGSTCNILWSRFMSGSDTSYVNALALDTLGNLYSAGATYASDVPGLDTGYQGFNFGSSDAFVMKHASFTGDAVWGTYFGGTDYDYLYAMKVDSVGNVVIGGYTYSTPATFPPTTFGAFQTVNNGGADIFVARLTPNGLGVNYCTYLGGINYEYLYDLTLDASDKIYLTGYTSSPPINGFPAKAGALSMSLNGGSDGFVSKLDPTLLNGAQLVWSTYLGGSSSEYPQRIKVDSFGSVYVAGVTYSPDFPLKNAFDNTWNGGEAFITRINNPSGSNLTLAWSSFLGGNDSESVMGMAFGASGALWVVGYTYSNNFTTIANPGPVPDSTLNGQEGFVTRIDNQDPNIPVLVSQYRMDNTTNLPLGAWTNESSIIIRATVTDPEEDAVALRVEIKPITQLFDGTGTIDSPFGPTGQITMTVPLPAGGPEFHWRCRSVDQHGHVSVWNSFGANSDGAAGPPFVNAGRDVGKDTTGPVVTIMTPVNADTYFTQLGTISLGGTTTDDLSGVVLVEWKNNNPGPGTFAAAGGTVANWSVGSVPLSALSSGVNQLTVRATDAAGNTGTDVITVTWDTAIPTLTITSPVTPPTTFTTGLSSVNLGGSWDDNIGVTSVNWTRTGGGVPTTNGSGTLGGGKTWTAAVALAPGTNTITVVAKDAANNQSTGGSGVISVTYDNVPPSITINTPSQTTTATSINITGTASDAGSGIQTVTWTSNRGFSGTATGTTSWDTNAAPQVQLLGGVNIITFTAKDGVNNTNSAQVTITRDINAPTVTITNPPNSGSYTTATTPLVIGGSAADDIAVQKVEWDTDQAPGVKHLCTLVGPANAPSWSATGGNAVPLNPGLNVITVTVTDTSNRTGTKVLNVTYSASAPSLVFTSPPSSNYVTASNTVNVAGTATSAAANIVSLTVQNLTTGVFSTFSPTGIGTPSVSFLSPNHAPVSLVQGTNTIEVKATDSSAPTPLVTIDTLTVIYDPTLPVVTITGPTGAGTWAQGTAVLSLNGVASDNRGVTKVQVSNTTTGVLNVDAMLAGPATSVTWSASIGLNPGSNNIVVTAQDEAGNSTQDTLTATYDTTLPDITITVPTSAPEFTTSGVVSIDIGGTIGDDVGISTITWSNARNGATGLATGFPLWSASAVPLDNGINVITVVARDTAGNTRNDSITIYLDSQIPTIQITAPTNTGSYNTSQATISVGGTAADDIAVASVSWTSQGTGPLKTGVAVGTTTWSIDSIPLDPGINTITVTAHDGRNALSDDLLPTSILVVNYDSVKPSLTIQVPTPPTYKTTSTPVLVSGIAGDAVGVTEVTWTNTATGGTGAASGLTNWSALIPLTSGDNPIVVKAKDAAGNTETQPILIVYDPAAPIVAVTSPTTAVSIITGTSPIMIGGTAQDDVGLQDVSWSIGGGAPVTLFSVNGFLDWSGPVTLSPGSNDVTFTATDQVGRTGTTRITIVYDPTAPTVNITTPTSDAVFLTTNSTIALAGVASDNLTVQSVTWSNAATADTGTAVGVGLWNIPTIDLVEGDNDITVTVTDSVGNVNTDTIKVVYDGTPPAIAITSPVIVAPATSYATNVRPFDILGTASDNLGIASITFVNSRGGGGSAQTTAVLPAKTTNWTASVYLVPSPPTNTVTITVTDQHGFTTSTSIDIDFTPENTPPTISISAPSATGSAVSATQLVDVSGKASDNVGVVSVTWKNTTTGVKGAAGLSVPVPAVADPNERDWLGTVPLAKGNNVIVVTVVDDAGNKTTSTITISYDPASDGIPPGITIVNPATNVYDTTTSPVLITVSATDNDGIASVTWTNSGTGSSGYATFMTGTNNWNALIAMSAGVNTIVFTAHDPSGNTDQDSMIVNFSPVVGVDIANPVVNITSHPTGVPLNVSSPTITLSGIASDNVLVADVVWLNAATSASGGADGTTTWDAPLVLVPGTNVITLRVYDSSGNTDTDQITINYSPPPPYVPAGHCGLLGVDGLVLAAAALLLRRRRAS